MGQGRCGNDRLFGHGLNKFAESSINGNYGALVQGLRAGPAGPVELLRDAVEVIRRSKFGRPIQPRGRNGQARVLLLYPKGAKERDRRGQRSVAIARQNDGHVVGELLQLVELNERLFFGRHRLRARDAESLMDDPTLHVRKLGSGPALGDGEAGFLNQLLAAFLLDDLH